jgi:hypothetical protein
MRQACRPIRGNQKSSQIPDTARELRILVYCPGILVLESSVFDALKKELRFAPANAISASIRKIQNDRMWHEVGNCHIVWVVWNVKVKQLCGTVMKRQFGLSEVCLQ